MFVAWLHFSLEKELDPVESELFRQMNLPQVYLGGLPLAFLNRSQLRWISPTLLDNWSNWRFEPEEYDRVTKMLGVFGDLVRNRRYADQRMKSGIHRQAESESDHFDPWQDEKAYSDRRSNDAD